MLRLLAPAELSLSALGITPRVQIYAPRGDVTVHTWQHGDAMIIGVQRDFSASASNERVVLTLPQAGEVCERNVEQFPGLRPPSPTSVAPLAVPQFQSALPLPGREPQKDGLFRKRVGHLPRGFEHRPEPDLDPRESPFQVLHLLLAGRFFRHPFEFRKA